MSTLIGWFLGVMLLASNVVVVVSVVRARKDPGRANIEKMIHRCRHGLRAVGLGFLITVGYAMWAVLQFMSARTDEEEATLLANAISGTTDLTALLLLGVLVPSAAIIYLNVMLRRAKDS